MAYFYGTPRNPSTNVTFDVWDMCESIKDFLLGLDWRTEAMLLGPVDLTVHQVTMLAQMQQLVCTTRYHRDIQHQLMDM